MLEVQDLVTLGIIGINIILALVLLVIYSRNYRVAKSRLTVGLTFFALAFLIQNALHFYFYEQLISQAIIGFTTVHLAVSILQMVGLLILLYVTWE